MKIYTSIEFQMTGDGLEEVRSESFEYNGEVAEAKGGGGSPPPPKPDLSGTFSTDTNRLWLSNPNAKGTQYSYDLVTGKMYSGNNPMDPTSKAFQDKSAQFLDNFQRRGIGQDYLLNAGGGNAFTSIGGITNRLNEYTSTADQLKNNLEDFSTVKSNVGTLQSGLKSLTGRYDTLGKDVGAFKNDFSSFKNSYQNQQQDYADRFNNLTTGIGSLSADYDDLSDSVKGLTTNYGNLSDSVSGLTDNVGILSTDVGALKRGIGSAIDGVSSLKSGLTTTNSTVKDLQVGLGTLGADQETMADTMSQFQNNTADFSEGVLNQFNNVDTRITGVESGLTDLAKKPSYTGISNAFSGGMTLGTSNPYLSATAAYSNPYVAQSNPYAAQNNPYIQNNYSYGSTASNLMNNGFSSFNSSPFYNLMSFGGF